MSNEGDGRLYAGREVQSPIEHLTGLGRTFLRFTGEDIAEMSMTHKLNGDRGVPDFDKQRRILALDYGSKAGFSVRRDDGTVVKLLVVSRRYHSPEAPASITVRSGEEIKGKSKNGRRRLAMSDRRVMVVLDAYGDDRATIEGIEIQSTPEIL